MWREVLEFDPEVVVVQFAIAALSTGFWSVLSLCKRCAAAQIPVVVTFHEPAREYDLLKSVSRYLYRAVARVTSVPIVFSPSAEQALIGNGLFDRVRELPLGTSGTMTISDDDLERVRRRYGISKPLVLTLGFTGFDKGTDVLLDAAPEIASQRGNDVQFLIAGSPRKRRGVFRLREYRDVAFQRRLENRSKEFAGVDVSFTGYVPDADVGPLLNAADVVALPYRRITQSAVANLALSSRAVVVSTNLAGLRNDLGDAAVYVEPGDAASLAHRISGLLGAENLEVRERMRALAEERAVNSTFEVVARGILAAASEVT